MPKLALTVNQHHVVLDVPPEASLLHLLRNDLGLNGPKYGCGLGSCGACTVHVDGIAARSCVIPAHGVAGRCVTTLEGLGKSAAHSTHVSPDTAEPIEGLSNFVGVPAKRDHWHPVQVAFEQAQAAQCGYCLNGMVMQAAALLAREPHPSEERIRSELSGNLCRCGTHVEIMDAVTKAIELMSGSARSVNLRGHTS